MDLHKLDQDRLLFTVMQGIHTESKCAAKGAAYEHKWKYTFLGKPVCCDAFRKLWGVCEHRFVLLRGAILKGSSQQPVDVRFITRGKKDIPSPVRSWIHTYLEELYHSEAEALPECLVDADVHWWGGNACEGDPYSPIAALPGEEVRHLGHCEAVETRWLPPGTVYDYWLSYNALYPEHKCSFIHFFLANLA